MTLSDAITTAVASPIPARAGVGLKADHYLEIVETQPAIGWFEVHAENYMGAGGAPHRYLGKIRETYPLSVHGVGLSIGSDSPLDQIHLARLKAVCERYEPGLISEHLAWSTHEGTYLNDLLPVPYTKETLARVCEHIDEVQTALGRRILLENPSTYVRFESSDMDEVAFLSAIVGHTGCGLLLDVNNVYVSGTNHGYTPESYIDAFPVEHVGEIHLGGHDEDSDETDARILIDAHASAVADDVWALYARAIARTGVMPTLIEWDSHIPEWSELFAEAERADEVIAKQPSDASAA